MVLSLQPLSLIPLDGAPHRGRQYGERDLLPPISGTFSGFSLSKHNSVPMFIGNRVSAHIEPGALCILSSDSCFCEAHYSLSEVSDDRHGRGRVGKEES